MAESKYLKKTQGNGASTTLSASITNADTAAPLTSDTAFDGEGMLLIDEGQATEEFAYGTAKIGSSITILADDRGLEGGSAQAHTDSATVKGIITSGMWNNVIASLTNVCSDTTGALDTTKVVDLTTAQTLTNKTLTSPVLGGTPVLDATSAIPFYTNSLSRQAIINGNFDVAQRGASIAMTAANAYTLDRWYCETATAGTDKTVSQEDGTGVNGSRYCARVKMVGDVDELLTFSQALESQDSIKFRGQKVTLSFYARGGAEFVSDNATLVSKIVTGKGTDQKVLAFTTSADGVSQNNTLTTSWQKFTCTTTAAIAADITQLGVSFAFTHAGSGTTTNYFEITQVQLCAGDVALPFMPKSYGQELQDCLRYYEASGLYVPFITGGNLTSCVNCFSAVNYLTKKRIAATPVVTNIDRSSFPATAPTVSVATLDGFIGFITANATYTGHCVISYTVDAEL